SQTAADGARLPTAFHVMVTPDYFATLGIKLIEGRLFPADIDSKSPRVVVVNESLARLLWPERSAIGQRLATIESGAPLWAEVIGIVRDVDTAASTNEPLTKLHVYKPLVHEPWPGVQIVVRSRTPGALAEAVRRTVNEISPDLATARLGTVRQVVDQQQHNLFLAGKTLTWFAVLGLALAAIGLYGVISNIVALRTGEIGIRLALGARPADVLALVFSYGLRLTAVGLVLGVVGAHLLSRLLRSMMPRVVTIDILTFSGVIVVLFCVAVVACWIPARRATKVDPLVALRTE
ncbi:MAG TPA: FtsX-like permease family protein, partial [Opitutus sp.]|nr:FtsX-like permease family protein [Opitutus sp.]